MTLVPLASLLASLAAALLYARDAEGRPLVRPRGATSRNVVARPPGDARPAAVVVAHADSARASLAFHPAFAGALGTAVRALHASLAGIVVLAGAAWVAQPGGGAPAWVRGVAAALGCYVLGFAAVLVHARVRMPDVAGANDGASGVEVLLRLAAEGPRPGVWFVVTGSEEAGMLGARAFVERHDARVARVVNVDGVGAGEIVVADEEGVLVPRRADVTLVAAAERSGAEARAFRVMPTDATAFLAARVRAATVIALDERGVVANSHRPSDVPANVDETAIARAVEVARTMVDAGVRAGAGAA